MALWNVWLTLLVILSNSLLEKVDAQSTKVKTSSDVIESLENLRKAMATLQTRMELQTITLSNLEAKADTQEALLNYLVTIARTQANLLNNLETKIHVQAKSLINLEVQSNIQINSLYKLEANLEMQATALNDFVAKEEWHGPIAQSPVNRTIEALEGDDVEIWCFIHGVPTPEMRWTRENGTLLTSDRAAVENYGKTLRIKKVQSSDEGSYVCVAANGLGTPAIYSVSLEVYGKYRKCNRAIESDKGNLEIEPSNSSCLAVIKLQNTTGFRLELDLLMTESILVIPGQNASNSNAQSIWIYGSKNVSYEFEGKKLAIVVPPGAKRTILNWRGLAGNAFENKSTEKLVNDCEGTLEWEPMHDGSGKIFWEFSHEMPVELNWTLNTDSAAQDQENPCENMFFSVMQIRPDGNINEIQTSCDGSSEGSLKLETHSQVLVLLHIKSVESTRSKLRVLWKHDEDDEPIKKNVDGIIAGTWRGAFVIPLNSTQTQKVVSGNIYGLTFDWISRRIYYSKSGVGIMRSNLDGSESEILVSDSRSTLFGLTIEPTSGNLYYGNRSRTIRVCDNDAIKCSTIIANSSDVSSVYGIAVHRSKGLLFWSIEGQKIARSNLDGSNATVLLERNVWGIDVDEHNDRLYWGHTRGIGSCDLNGQDIRMLPNVNTQTSDVTVNNDTVYYATWDANTIHVISKSGTNKRLVVQLTNNILHIPLVGTQVSNQPANPCKESKCAYLCVLVTRWTYRCTCPEGKVLNPDGKTCNV